MIDKTYYYDEFLRYFELAKDQQAKTNLGSMDYAGSTGDPLMDNIYLYDVVERSLAGFSQIVHDCFHGYSKDHPYHSKILSGKVTQQRKTIVANWDQPRLKYGLYEWLYIFMIHRITGSAINYATIPSGYHNSILFDLHQADNVEQMSELIKEYKKPMFTSVGYQIAAFPKIPVEMANVYATPGKYWMCEVAPKLIREFTDFVEGKQHTFREMMSWLENWSKSRGQRVFWFHYAAFLADIADWFPELVHRDSMFFYGSNAVECISYLATPKTKMPKEQFLDEVMQMAMKDTGGLAYNLEDVACDFIRYVENYVSPGVHYSHIDMDKIWNTSSILDHPKGRQKAMLHLGLIDSFNTLKTHPSDLKILNDNNLSIEEYKQAVKTVDFTKEINTGIKPQTNLMEIFA